MNKLSNFSLSSALLENYHQINQELLTGLDLHIDDQSTRKTHEFFGRYENIYIDSERHHKLEVTNFSLLSVQTHFSNYKYKAILLTSVRKTSETFAIKILS